MGHDRKHDIDSTNEHAGVSGATENHLVSFDANGLPQDSSQDIVAPATIGDGGTTDYVEIKADGEINLHGTARAQQCVTLANLDLSKGGTSPDQVITGNFIGWSYDTGDDSVFMFKLPDDWATGTDLSIRMRYYIDEAYITNNGEVRFQVAWTAVPADASEAIDGASTTVQGADQDIPATAKHLQTYTIGTIAGGSLAAGDDVGMTFSRIALTGGSDPTADPVVTCIGVVYTKDRLGL